MTQQEVDAEQVKIDQQDAMWSDHDEYTPRKQTPVSMVHFFDSTRLLIAERKEQQGEPF